MRPSKAGLSTTSASATMVALGGLHLLWATGSAWPLRDTREFAELVGGQTHGRPPPPLASVAVAALLTTAGALVSGRPRRYPAVRRVGSAGVVSVLATRGVLGLAGRTDLVSPGATSERFRALDRHYYGPLCLGLAAASLPAVREARTSPR